MYDAWIDDILDDVRNNVVGEFWHPYFDTPFHKKVLKHLIQQSKFDNDNPVMGDRYDLYFKYNNYYRLENHSETDNYLHNYLGVEDKDINNILMLYAMILKHIVDTQGYEDNMLSESNDKQKGYLDKVVDRLLKESEYRFWDDGPFTIQVQKENLLKKIRVDIKFGLVNLWREDPIEYFDMKMVKDNLTKRRRKTEYLEDYERDQLTNIYGLNSDEIMEVIHKYYREFYSNIYNSYLEMDEDDKVPTSKPEKWMKGDEVFDIGGRLNESYANPKLDKIINHFFKRIEFDDDEELVSIKDFPSNPFLEYSSFCTYESLETYIAGKIQWVLEHIYGLNKREQLEAGYSINNLIRKRLKNCDLKGRYNFNTYMSDEDYKKAIDYNTNKHLNESLSSDVNKDVDKLFKSDSTLKGEENIKNKFKKLFGMDDWVADHAMVLCLSKQQSLNESIHKKSPFDSTVERIISDLLSDNGETYNRRNSSDKITEKELGFLRHKYYRTIIKHLVSASKIKPGVIGGTRLHFDDGTGLKPFTTTSILTDYVEKTFAEDDKVAYDLVFTYLRLVRLILDENKNVLKEENKKGMDLKYLFKVADSIMKEIEISNDNYKVRGFGSWSEMSTGGRGFWVALRKHAKDIYGLTKAETEMVSDLVWDSLNAKNILVYNKNDKQRRSYNFGSLREQHYNDSDERAIERNKKIFKRKGITVLSTDTNVPFYKRIDSKEIRFLKKVADMLINETKLEEADDIFDFIVYAPFGNYELKVLLNEYRHYGFEKYVSKVFAAGHNQIKFPVGNDIAQASEGQFLWEMYKDKLRRKQIQMVNPGLPDIPDDAIIIEQDLSNDEHKSLLQSFEVMDTPEEIASEELGNMIKWVKDLPEILFLYRVLYLDDENQINYDELGSHYSQDRTDLINNHYDRGSIYGDMGEHAYLITVKVPKSEVDVMETLNNNILYPHEKEITLKNKGIGAQYLDVEKI